MPDSTLTAAEAAKNLTAAALDVAIVASEIASLAERQEDGSWVICADDMHRLRATIGAWQRAGETALRALGISARGDA